MARTVLITGASGNLGGHLARDLLDSELRLRLMVHTRPVDPELRDRRKAETVWADLADPGSLAEACQGADCVVHFAGKLFAPGPRRFLPITNTLYARNLIDVALAQGVQRFVLVSFPHVEGPTGPDRPATDRLDGNPVSVHARTRLEEERYLFKACDDADMEPVVLRSGMIYSRGVLMIDYARKLMQRRLLGVWRKPTWIHLISLTDFLTATRAAVVKKSVEGIFNLGDDFPITLQEFLDKAAEHWGLKRPWRAPRFVFYLAAWCTELYARIFKTAAPLTGDFIRIGMVPYYMNTERTRQVLLPRLKYPTWEQGFVHM
jgi:nucleoside-diphosphate-sugar epimerase